MELVDHRLFFDPFLAAPVAATCRLPTWRQSTVPPPPASYTELAMTIGPKDEQQTRAFRGVTAMLEIAEQIIFAVVGILLAVVALILAFRSLGIIGALVVAPTSASITLTSDFLDLVLLILMLAEVIYTVTLSLRGEVLSPQPFLLVALIAVIRRILLVTVQEVQSGTARSGVGLSQGSLDLALLTLVAIAFVAAIYVLHRQGHR